MLPLWVAIFLASLTISLFANFPFLILPSLFTLQLHRAIALPVLLSSLHCIMWTNAASSSLLGLPNHILFQIIVDGLSFHIPSFPTSVVFQAWNLWCSSVSSSLINSSDALKNAAKTVIAIYNDTEDACVAVFISHLNSIFSDTSWPSTALSSYISDGSHNLLTDSLSVLRIFQNVSLRSPRVSLLIHNLQCNLLLLFSCSVHLCYFCFHF